MYVIKYNENKLNLEHAIYASTNLLLMTDKIITMFILCCKTKNNDIKPQGHINLIKYLG